MPEEREDVARLRRWSFETIVQTVLILGAMLGVWIRLENKVAELDVKVDTMWSIFVSQKGVTR